MLTNDRLLLSKAVLSGDASWLMQPCVWNATDYLIIDFLCFY